MLLTEEQKHRLRMWWKEGWKTTVQECGGDESEALEYMLMDVWMDVFNVSETDPSLSEDWKMDVEHFVQELANETH